MSSPLPGLTCDMSTRVLRVALQPLSTYCTHTPSEPTSIAAEGPSLLSGDDDALMSSCVLVPRVAAQSLFLILDGTQSRERRAHHKQRTAIMRMGLSLCPRLVSSACVSSQAQCWQQPTKYDAFKPELVELIRRHFQPLDQSTMPGSDGKSTIKGTSALKA